MLLGVIADDFTGASDIANTLAKGLAPGRGLRTMQFLGLPDGPAPAGCEAGVVALKSRSIPAEAAVEQSLAALAWLQAQGCRQIVFKYCSTFDSTPAGNIGPVGEALAASLGAAGVVVCPVFPTLNRSLYQGHLFVGDRLLNESGLEEHPLNPMTDADIRRWLGRQARQPVGLVAWPVVAKGEGAIRAALAQAAAAGQTLVVVDAIADADLLGIGRAVADAPLVTGGSGIALGLPDNFIRQGLAEGQAPSFAGVAGPAAILAGSCSRATRAQVERHASTAPSFALDVPAVLRGEIQPETLVAFVGAHSAAAPLIYSSAAPETVAALQAAHGREQVALALDTLFASTARALLERGVKRLVVAGGETSGAVVSALDLDDLELGPEIDPGVPVLVARGPEPVALALKSGNFGGPDFFAKAVDVLGGGTG